jgi:hypothetical protein
MRLSLTSVLRTAVMAEAVAAALTFIACQTAAAINCNAASDRDALVTDQRQWIRTRDDLCNYADSSGRKLVGPPLTACLRKESDRRRLFLCGVPADGPGSPNPTRPFFLKGKDGRVISGLRFAPPRSDGERLFNRTVDDQVKAVNVANGSEGDPTDNFSMTLNYASPVLVSAEVVISYPTSAHPVPSHQEINVNLAAGRMLTFEDVFRRDAHVALVAQCRPQLDDFIGEAAKADLGDNEMRDGILKDREKLVRTSAGDMTRWSLGSRQMTLTIDDGANSRVTGICRLDTARLRPLMQPGFSPLQ